MGKQTGGGGGASTVSNNDAVPRAGSARENNPERQRVWQVELVELGEQT